MKFETPDIVAVSAKGTTIFNSSRALWKTLEASRL